MIIQRDLENNFIATHDTKTAAARILGVDESTIRKAVKFNRTVMGKFKFVSDSTNEELVPSSSIYTNLAEVRQNAPKVLVLDIETAPIRAYTWGLWKQNIFLDQIISNFFIISWAAKWLDDNTTFGLVLTPNEIQKENDKNILIPLWELLDEADVVIAHNGDQFDIPKINSRFIVNGILPPSPYKQIDTKKISKNIFGFSSNKLEALARQLGVESKFTTTMQLWVDCMKGDAKALFRMLDYNEQDVIVLENVFKKLRPYAKGMPNLNMYSDNEHISCPHCDSEHIALIPNKYFYTNSVRYQLYTCHDCGAHSRGKKAIPYTNKKQISSIPR